MATPKLAPAFALVRNLLSEQPRTFQSLLSSGLASHPSSSPDSSSSTPSSARKGKAREVSSPSANATSSKVPEGHPFVSATFLKNRILPVLESQRLIHLAPTRSTSGQTSFQWSLGPSPRSTGPSTPDMPAWDTEAHWKRLLEGDHPGSLAHALNVHRTMEKSLRRDEAIASGKVRLGDREMREWAGRAPVLTVRSERGHLNVRRERARGRKERERIGGE